MATRARHAWFVRATAICSSGAVLMSGCGGSESLGLDLVSGTGSRLVLMTPATPLHAEVNKGKACFWFEVPDGSAVSVAWPSGSKALANPLRVLDAAGKEIVREGQRDLVLGGTPFDSLKGCHAGSTVFAADTVSHK